MAVVLRVLLDHVDHDPAHVDLAEAAVGPHVIQVDAGEDLAAALAGGDEAGGVGLDGLAVLERKSPSTRSGQPKGAGSVLPSMMSANHTYSTLVRCRTRPCRVLSEGTTRRSACSS